MLKNHLEQSNYRWLETLWRSYDVTIMYHSTLSNDVWHEGLKQLCFYSYAIFFLSLCIKFVSFMTIAYILTVISLNAIIAPSTSNMGNIFALLALCAGAPLVTGGFPLTEDHKCGPLMIYLHEHAFQQTVELIDMGRLKCVMIMK